MCSWVYHNAMTAQLPHSPHDLSLLIKQWGQALGFQQVGISQIDLEGAGQRLEQWIRQGFHGSMDYMARHGSKRYRPTELEPGTVSVISVRMDYLPDCAPLEEVLENDSLGAISRYALGRDYHKLMRKRLQQLASQIADTVGPIGYRVFVDSAPVMEKPLAQQAGLGWQGKHTNLVHPRAGSWFFLGEIYTELTLPADTPTANHCGRCQACIDICPTRAIIAPYQLDARLCISYLTIELHGSIPEPLRPLLGNRIYGCDDCQLVCPWNRFARISAEADFLPRHGLDAPELLILFAWSEEEFLRNTEGTPIRRLGHARWLRNIAVALGNGRHHAEVADALRLRLQHPDEMVREHVQWALATQYQKAADQSRKLVN